MSEGLLDERANLEILEGGVCAASGFRASGVAAGIKPSGALDLALVVSDYPASAAGIFTTNRMSAAPVRVSRSRLAGGKALGVVANSGCANACTGPRGLKDAEAMADAAAEALGFERDKMLVCSTGLIGSYLPMDMVRAGIRAAALQLKSSDEEVMRAIMTTDTRPKKAAVGHADGWRLGGIAKGAGMIAPSLATMLAVMTTDAQVNSGDLQHALAEAGESTFNAVSVDGGMSTNDTVLVLANGRSGVKPRLAEVTDALHAVCGSLARQIATDGEGATKLVSVRVSGARDRTQAKIVARAVADSLLVKTALYGGDANWGRVAAALGAAPVEADFDRVSISIAGVTLLDRGVPATAAAVAEARVGMKSSEFEVACHLGAGEAKADLLTTDLTPEYVRLNAEYES